MTSHNSLTLFINLMDSLQATLYFVLQPWEHPTLPISLFSFGVWLSNDALFHKKKPQNIAHFWTTQAALCQWVMSAGSTETASPVYINPVPWAKAGQARKLEQPTDIVPNAPDLPVWTLTTQKQSRMIQQ